MDVDDEDPGWRIRWSMLPMGVMPHLYFMRRDLHDDDTLSTLRSIFVSFSTALVLIGVVRVIIGNIAGRAAHPAIAAGVVVGVTAASVVAQELLAPRLDCASDLTLLASFRSRFFLRVAFANAVAVIAFVLSVVIGPWWIYLVGVAGASIGFVRAAPTRRRLVDDQQRLSRDGCRRSLVGVLRSSTGRAAAPAAKHPHDPSTR